MPAELALAAEAEDHQVLASARLRLLFSSLLTFAVLAVLVVVVAQKLAEHRADADAQTRARAVAAVVGATVGLAGEESRIDLDRVVPAVAAREGVSHVLVWRADGEVAWSDSTTLIGRRYSMEPALQALFGADSSLVGRPRPVDLESAAPPLDAFDDYEVFTAVSGADGEAVVVESYVDEASIAAERHETLVLLLPLALTALLLVELVAVLLGMSLIQQVRRGRRDRVALVNRAMAAVEHERREVAHQLHDGVVQDLAATRYAIGALTETLPPSTPVESLETLERISSVLDEELKDLRGLLGHLIPPDVESRSLEEALRSLVRHLVPAEMSCRLVVRCHGIGPSEGRTAYRVVREGVRNAVVHSGATHILVAVTTTDDAHLSVLVEDNGHGFEPTVGQDRPSYGLDLLRGLLAGVGGSLSIENRESGGVVLTATFPVESRDVARARARRRALSRG